VTEAEEKKCRDVVTLEGIEEWFEAVMKLEVRKSKKPMARAVKRRVHPE